MFTNNHAPSSGVLAGNCSAIHDNIALKKKNLNIIAQIYTMTIIIE